MNTHPLQSSRGLISFLQDLSVERAENEALELLPDDAWASNLYGIFPHLMGAVLLPHLLFPLPSLTAKPQWVRKLHHYSL